MKNASNKIFIPLLILSVPLVILGVLLKVMHWPYGNAILQGGFIVAIIITALAAYEIWQSDIARNEKILWTVLILFGSTFGVIAYTLSVRKQIFLRSYRPAVRHVPQGISLSVGVRTGRNTRVVGETPNTKGK